MLPASLVSLIKQKPVLALLGGVGAIFSCFHTIESAVSDAPNAWRPVARLLGVPECGSYSEVYYYETGHFKRIDKKWYEFKNNETYRFTETSRGPDPDSGRYYIYLTSETKHKEDPRWQDARYRLPVCGGLMEFRHIEKKDAKNWEPAEPWQPCVRDVKRRFSKDEEQTQAKWEDEDRKQFAELNRR